ncbi:M23 family metallopeptidase [Herbiconiux sp. CPCC 203407]|uniref:M23 family metallopeptidase n=1 Tax=Herbiconiux oxytropis TaxID=2970915 RepID=A0AA42BSQ5_9MICO|nr:M23 family metallopeptidase [Herbiconiux oxytropis]MCS5720954.1 M23 family metallopeptidase [Herbiconiux oxytropis]MCS5724431.1 M23 family metallopeptidase [Herbiconiux oxytropis]
MNFFAGVIALLAATIVLSVSPPLPGALVGTVGAAGSAHSPAPERGNGEAPEGAGTWLWPIEPRPPVAAEFRAPATRYGAGHRGLDLEAGPGVQIRAPADGVIAFAGVVVDRPVVSVEHAGGVRSTFEPAQSLVAAGGLVARGQPLAVVAVGGHCADGCLHLGARLNGGYVNPRLFLSGVPRAVLLPLAQDGPQAGPMVRERRGESVRRGGARRDKRLGAVLW